MSDFWTGFAVCFFLMCVLRPFLVGFWRAVMNHRRPRSVIIAMSIKTPGKPEPDTKSWTDQRPGSLN